ncbi:MAG TPA: tetratricopeptide repeat protein, partial [Thermoanaerobaculia bacterium]|nr:tetratricopeptide repeat protein [Thermoanaerobaculia bacterium]
MTILRARSRIFFLLPLLAMLCLACASAPPLPAPDLPPLLSTGRTLEREIRAGEIHEYRIAVQSGDYARVTVDQNGADVALRLIGPAGEEVAAADGVGGRKELEMVSWIAAGGGDFRLSVTSKETGLYELSLEELRPSKEGDRERVAAEKAYFEALHRLALEDQDSKEKALLAIQEVLAVWKAIGDRRNEVAALNQIGAIHRGRGRAVFALALYGRALTLARESGDRRGEAQTWNNLGVAHHQLGQYPVAIQDLRQARRIWEELDEPRELANTLYSLGVVQYDSGEPEAALETFNSALVLRDDQPLLLTGIASIFRDRGEGDKALEIYRQALDLSRSAKDRNDEANVLQNMASIYLRRGELQEALELYSGALEIHRALGNPAPEARVLSYLGATALYLGDLEQALGYYTRALQLQRELGNQVWEGYTLR